MPKSSSSAQPAPSAGPIALLVGTRKGAFILRSDRARNKWKMSDGILIGSIIHHMVLDPRDGCTMLMTARTGHLGPTVFRSMDYGKSWKEAAKPPAFPKAAEGEKGISVDHNFWLSPGHSSEPGVWYLGSSPIGLFRSEDGGATWDAVEGFSNYPVRAELLRYDAPPDGATLHSIMIDPRDSNHMYIGLSGGGVFESMNKGAD